MWKVGAGVTRWKVGDEVVVHCNQASYEDPEVHGLDPMAAPSQKIWGYETTWGSFAQFTKVQAQQLLPQAEGAHLGGVGLLRPRLLHRLPHAAHPLSDAGGRERADLGRGRRPRRVRHPAVRRRRRQLRGRRLLGGEGRAGQAPRRRRLHQPRRVRGDDAQGGETPRRRRPASASPVRSPSTSRRSSATRPTSSSSTSAKRRSQRRCSPPRRSAKS